MQRVHLFMQMATVLLTAGALSTAVVAQTTSVPDKISTAAYPIAGFGGVEIKLGLTVTLQDGIGDCLEVRGANSQSGAMAGINTCNGMPSESFTMNLNGTLTNFTGNCLDASNISALVFDTCNGKPAQQWQQKGTWLVGAGGNCARSQTGFLLNRIVMLACDGSATGNWQIINTPTVLEGAGTKCLDIPNGSTSAGAPLQLYECNHSPESQIFTFTAADEIRNLSGECLDVPAGDATSGQVQMWPCNGGTNQKWHRQGRQIVSSLSDGKSLFGLCVSTVASFDRGSAALESAKDHTAVGLAPCDGTTAQQWIEPDLFHYGPATLLVVTSDAFAPTFAPFISHKLAIGVLTKLLTMSQVAAAYPAPFTQVSGFKGNDDALSLKYAIEDHYRNFGTKYVLLGGDNSQVPMRFRGGLNGDNVTHYFAYSDLYYANLYSGHSPGSGFHSGFDNWDANGNGYYDEMKWSDPLPNPDNVDGFPDVAIGRIPAYSDAVLEATLNKIIAYENLNPVYGGSGFPPVGRFGWIADTCYGGSDSDISQISRKANQQDLFIFPFAEEIGDNNGACLPFSSPGLWIKDNANWGLLENAIQNNNYEFLTYVGHGGATVWGYNGGWNWSQTSALTNKYQPVVFAAACQTSQIAEDFGSHPDGVFPPIYDPNASNASAVSISSLFLFNQSGGAVGYIGENLVMQDDAGTGFMGYLFSEQANGYARLGDMYRMAQQDYFNANFYNSTYDPHFSAPRLYLGTMVLLGDPSMRTP